MSFQIVKFKLFEFVNYVLKIVNKGENQVKKTEDADYVVKIEPKDNGPLFCETHFYINCTKEEDSKKNKLKNSSIC